MSLEGHPLYNMLPEVKNTRSYLREKSAVVSGLRVKTLLISQPHGPSSLLYSCVLYDPNGMKFSTLGHQANMGFLSLHAVLKDSDLFVI